MDESLSQAMNFINEEKSSESSNVLEALPWQKKAEMSDPCDGLFVFHVNMKKYNETCEVPVLSRTCSFQETIKHAEERDLHCTLPSPKQFSLSTRRKKTEKEIALNRACKKFELAWKNRVPIDGASLCSTSNKDAFDLRDLSESLPSSTSEKKRARTKWQQKPLSCFSQMRQNKKFQTLTNHSFSPFSRKMKRLYLSARLPASETIPSVDSSHSEKCVMKEFSFRKSQAMSQSWSNMKRICNQVRSLEFEKESASNKQKETSNEQKYLDMGKVVQNWIGFDLDFTEMSDDKQEEEKQNSGVENNQQSIGLAPMQKLHPDMGQCSSWDSKRNSITDFEFRNAHVSLNSPNKGNADNDNQLLSMQRVLEKTLLQAQKKLRALNYLEGDGSESETSSKQAFRTPIHHHLNSKKETDNLCSRQLEKGKRIKDMKESVKSFRSLQRHFLLGNAKSDKVVPD